MTCKYPWRFFSLSPESGLIVTILAGRDYENRERRHVRGEAQPLYDDILDYDEETWEGNYTEDMHVFGMGLENQMLEEVFAQAGVSIQYYASAI